MLDWHLLGLPVTLNCRNGEKLRKLQAHGPLYGPSLMKKARFFIFFTHISADECK